MSTNDYDYKAGKIRIDEILNGRVIVTDQNEIPESDQFTFENGYFGWVSSIFVDIRNSHQLFKKHDKVIVSKVIRCFSSEIIEILRDDTNLREIGVRGDCVYAIYTTPTQQDVYDVAEKTYAVNTYISALNNTLTSKQYPVIKVGIGMSTARELVVRPVRNKSTISNLVWIGEAVTTASKLSSLANTRGYECIIFAESSYNAFIPLYIEEDPTSESLFTQKVNSQFGKLYSTNLVILKYNAWIKEGMKI